MVYFGYDNPVQKTITRKETKMRHVVTQYRDNVPYVSNWDGKHYTFKNSTPNRVYVKVLKFVESHPRCKRSDIQFGVWGNHNKSNSTLFAQMLYHDILDYNGKFEYKVTRKGKAILKRVEKMA